jgi:type VI protein secretion system component VasK
MSPLLRQHVLPHLWVWAVYMVTAGLALYHGFGFGMKIGGLWMAVITALNTLVMAVLVVGGLMDAVQRRWRQRRGEEPTPRA